MSLLNKKIFITETAWMAILDSDHQQHKLTKDLFKNLLDNHHRLMTSSYVLDAVIEGLKGKNQTEKATEFLDLIDRAVLSNSIKVFWLNRRLRRKALKTFLENSNKRISDTLNIILIKQKKVDAVFTLNQAMYKEFDLNCLELD